MDPSYRSPVEPPKDWAKSYYKKPPPGKFYRFINIRNETFLAYFLVVTCTSLFWYPLIIKPVIQSIKSMWKHPEILSYEIEHLFKSSLSDEQKMEIRRNGGMNVHKLSDLWETQTMRWQPPTDEGQMTAEDRHMQEANRATVAALQKRNVEKK